mmetsp:Transcript_69337/g.206475  ORF Transcript_69337/g.206475 Transcript_69337/m.206475 type:complete len:249 (-) Transcript_69337:577-1323(-)
MALPGGGPEPRQAELLGGETQDHGRQLVPSQLDPAEEGRTLRRSRLATGREGGCKADRLGVGGEGRHPRGEDEAAAGDSQPDGGAERPEGRPPPAGDPDPDGRGAAGDRDALLCPANAAARTRGRVAAGPQWHPDCPVAGPQKPDHERFFQRACRLHDLGPALRGGKCPGHHEDELEVQAWPVCRAYTPPREEARWPERAAHEQRRDQHAERHETGGGHCRNRAIAAEQARLSERGRSRPCGSCCGGL